MFETAGKVLMRPDLQYTIPEFLGIPVRVFSYEEGGQEVVAVKLGRLVWAGVVRDCDANIHGGWFDAELSNAADSLANLLKSYSSN